MIKAVIFDMFETLISYHTCPVYFGTQMAMDAGIPVQEFLTKWRGTDCDRSTGKCKVEDVLEQSLKAKGVSIGLISNCYLEEAIKIRESELFPYFDAVCLSNEQGICKPDKEIYYRCLEALSVQPQECLYVGDGGSRELETAQELGMKAMQATWYLKEGTSQPVGRMPEFEEVKSPMDVVEIVK